MNQVVAIKGGEQGEPLSNVEAEAALLGALLIEADLIPTIAQRVREEDFLEPVHGRLFAAIFARHAAKKAVNAILLWPDFATDEGLQELGGRNYLAKLTGDGQGLLAPLDFADQIHELARRRRCRDGHMAAAQAFADTSIPVEEITIPADAEGIPIGRCLPLEWASDVQPVLDGFWLIDDYLPKSGPAVIYGHPGCGKTFLALSIAAHVAEGKQWAGRHVVGGPVVYLVAEGLTGFRNRLAAMFDAGLMSRSAPFAYIPVPIDLQSPAGDVDSLIATVRHMAGKLGSPPALIVIDTLSKTFGAGKENTDDMATYVANCERVAGAFDCLTLIVHHRPKDSESRELRGHSSLRGGVVTSILVEGDQLRTATTVKQKDGPEGERVAFELERVVLGEDRRGKEVTSCLVRIVDADDATISSIASRHSLSGHNRVALQVIEEMLERFGEDVPKVIPADAIDRSRVTRVIHVGQIRTRLADTLSGAVKADPDKLSDTVKRTVKRALAQLETKEILGSWGDWLWLL